ncbi:MAG TPA: hypothetical protein VKF39_04290, partial [Nitrososphaerales archaeon]|nr:hypothetical protein [Nitrososphaerales archaeon]
MANDPTETERAWMAGFLDGEGLVTIVRQIRRSRPSPAYRCYVCVCNTDREVLTIYLSYYGGAIYQIHEKRRDKLGKKWADAFNWYCPISSTKRLLLDLLPFLRLKKRQACLVIEFVDNKRAFARGKRKGRGGSSPLTKDEIAFRERLRRQVRLLNRKGKYARA